MGQDKAFESLQLGGTGSYVDGILGNTGDLVPLGTIQLPNATYSTTSTSWTSLIASSFDQNLSMVNFNDWEPANLESTFWTLHTTLHNNTSGETTYVALSIRGKGRVAQASRTGTGWSRTNIGPTDMIDQSPAIIELDVKMKVSGGTGKIIDHGQIIAWGKIQ